MNDDTKAALALVARYTAAAATKQYVKYGDGPYVVFAHFRDRPRVLTAVGFETEHDARTVMEYASTAAPLDMAQKVAEFEREHGMRVTPPPFTRFEICKLEPITSAAEVAERLRNL